MKSMRYRKFTDEHREMLVQKFLSRGDMSIDVFCRENSVSSTAIYRWVATHGREPNMKLISRTPSSWEPSEKFRAVIAFDALSVSEQGAFLRREGVHADHIEMWREKMQKSLEPENPDTKSEKGELMYKILELEKDLRRKEKALAEAASLLLLKKKADLIWGSEEEK